jgi:ribonuclease HI
MGSILRSITHRWVSWGDFLYICIFLIQFSFFLLGLQTCSFFMLSFSLWQISSESEVFVGFVDGVSRHTWRLASIAWVIFTPQVQLLLSKGICLGDATNNVVEYSTLIEFLRDALSHDISHLRVYLDTQLVVSQLNGVYRVYDPTLHRRFLRVCLLEQSFDYITYIHVPRRLNQITDTLANHVLDWHLTHT